MSILGQVQLVGQFQKLLFFFLIRGGGDAGNRATCDTDSSASDLLCHFLCQLGIRYPRFIPVEDAMQGEDAAFNTDLHGVIMKCRAK